MKKEDGIMHCYGGIYPALLTPFKVDGSINYCELKKLTRMNLEKGVKGFYVGGSTSECFLLSLDERKMLLDAVIEENNGEGVIVSHIGCIGLKDAVELACHAKAAGADAVSSIPPFYYGFSAEEIRSYYLGIVDMVDIPMLIYHFPANSGVKLTAEDVSAYLKDSRFVGIKYTSNDLYLMSQIRMTNPDAVIFNGYDEIFLSGLAAGADGGIGSTYNFMAEKFIAIHEAFLKSDLPAAQRLQSEAVNIINGLIKVGVMPGEKAILDMMGFDMGDCRKPFCSVTDEEKAYLKKLVTDNGIEL
jgi:N-acetylneuraminate lyase